jgi:mRNA interferase HigB
MHVISRKRLQEFWKGHPDAEKDLLAWYKVAKKARWTKFADVRATFRSADQVKRCVVFNIVHNRYRLIVIITGDWKRILVRRILTHKDYDRDDWKSDCGA